MKTAEELQAELDALRQEMTLEQSGMLWYLAAVAHKCGTNGVLTISAADMEAASNMVLERADTEDGGVLIRVTPDIVEAQPVLAKAEPIILLPNG